MSTPQSPAVINEEVSITRRLVANDERPAMLPKYFPGIYLKAEPMIYHWMERLCLSYSGGYWHMYELSNGGFYMAPDTDVRFETLCQGWGVSVDLSADAAGLVACLCAVNQLANHTAREDLIRLYYLLRDYAFEHEEAGNIYRAID